MMRLGKHVKVCFAALLLSALALYFNGHLRTVQSGEMPKLDSQHDSIRTENSELSKNPEKRETDHSLLDLVIPKSFGEARRVLKDYKFEDIMNMKPIRYLGSFKNPCWIGTEDNGPINDNKIHCLPYFYLIGVKKCGTSDLFHRILGHPEVTSTSFKELQWFPHRRFLIDRFYMKSEQKRGLTGLDPRQLNYYVRMLDIPTNSIVSGKKKLGNRTSGMVTGEGTPGNLNLEGAWELLPGNEGLSEPRYTNLHYIKHLIPQSKIIIIFRNPTDRLYSDFLMDSKVKERTLFHQYATEVVEMYKKCFKDHTFRSCIYNHTLTDMYPVRFEPTAGFYAFFMKELRGVFPENQILPVLYDDYIAKPAETVSKVYSFLDLSSLDSKSMINIVKGPVHMSGAGRKSEAGSMLEETRKMLNEFYRSSNEEMAQLMNDERYLFSEEQ